jgi:hypothetical protein
MSLYCTSGPYPKTDASGSAVQFYCFNIHRSTILGNPACVITDREYKLRISSYAIICILMSHPLSYILSTMFLKAFILHSSLNLTAIEDSKIYTSTILISPLVFQDVDALRFQEN